MSRPHTSANRINTGNFSEKDFSMWEWEDVNHWLINNNLKNYAENFEKYEINGYDLCYLTNEDFNEIKITNFHDRNLILKKIRLMTLEQLKIQLIHEDKNFTIQLEFDPNFTIENLTNSIIDLLRIQNGLIYFSTLDNEVLIPNLKIVDLIFLNPQKYKKLKVITTTSNFSNFQGEDKYEKGEKSLKNYTSKRYDVLQSTSEFLDDKDTNKVNYGLYKLSDDTNLKSTGNINVTEYNLPNEKPKDATNEINSNGDYKYKSDSFLNVTKDKEIQNKINYLRSKNNSLHDDEYLKHGYEEYTSNYNKNINANRTNLDVSKQETVAANSTAGKNLSNYEYSNYYDKNESSYLKEKRNSKINTAGQKYEYDNNLVEMDMNSKVANSALPKHYSSKYISYGDNNNANDMISNNKEIVERSKSHFNLIPFADKNLLRRESATPNRIEDSVRGSAFTTNPNEYNTNKYNFSERDDDNRRFSSEKRNFRNNTTTGGKNEDKPLSELENKPESKSKYEKYDQNYVEKLKYKYNDELESLNYDKDSFKSPIEPNNPTNTNLMDIKSKINSIRTQVNSNISFDRRPSEKKVDYLKENNLEQDNESKKTGRINIPVQSGYKTKI